MGYWDKHWFGPVAAIRPYLFQKCFLLVVAFDLLVLMVERGGRYGLDKVPFNVPHFKWLDGFHGLFLTNGVPDATYYVAVLTLTSFLAFSCVLAGHRRWLMACVCLFYTYAWAMSRLDSYLHHYMLSLILFCMVFFPSIDGRIFKRWLAQHLAKAPKKKRSKQAGDAELTHQFGWLSTVFVGLAIAYRLMLSGVYSANFRWVAMFLFCGLVAALVWRFHRLLRVSSQQGHTEGVGPLINSWAVRLLATTVGVIYVFTSIAKMDAEWCGGHTLRAVGTTADVLLPIEQLAGSIGISKDWFWSGLATFVIPLELALAAAYLIAARQDEENRVWLPRLCLIGWLLAVGLHLNNEMMNLIIQWFGYYMLLLATLLLLPARILLILGTMFYWPECWVRDRLDHYFESWSNSQKSLALGLVTFAAIGSLAAFGIYVMILGSTLASISMAVVLVLLLVAGLVFGWPQDVTLRLSMTAFGASLLMLLAVAQSSMRFDYYDLRGKTLQQLGDNESAISEMEIAAELPAPSMAAAADLHMNLGLAYRRTGKPKEAALSYRRAIGLDPRQFLAHYSLANLEVSLRNYEQAEQHYRAALEIKSDFSDAYVNLGNVLEYQDRVTEAIKCYELALEIEKGAADIQQMLESAQRKLQK